MIYILGHTRGFSCYYFADFGYINDYSSIKLSVLWKKY